MKAFKILLFSLFFIGFPIFKGIGQPNVPKMFEKELKSKVLKKIKRNRYNCKNCGVMIIYWLEYPKNYSFTDTLEKINKNFVDSLDLVFITKKKSIIGKNKKDILYYAIAYDTVTYEARYFQSEKLENIYVASTYEKYLAFAIRKYNIKRMFYMQNVINSDSPYLLLDKNDRMSILTFYINSADPYRIQYRVVPVDEYSKGFSIQIR